MAVDRSIRDSAERAAETKPPATSEESLQKALVSDTVPGEAKDGEETIVVTGSRRQGGSTEFDAPASNVGFRRRQVTQTAPRDGVLVKANGVSRRTSFDTTRAATVLSLALDPKDLPRAAGFLAQVYLNTPENTLEFATGLQGELKGDAEGMAMMASHFYRFGQDPTYGGPNLQVAEILTAEAIRLNEQYRGAISVLVDSPVLHVESDSGLRPYRTGDGRSLSSVPSGLAGWWESVQGAGIYHGERAAVRSLSEFNQHPGMMGLGMTAVSAVGEGLSGAIAEGMKSVWPDKGDLYSVRTPRRPWTIDIEPTQAGRRRFFAEMTLGLATAKLPVGLLNTETRAVRTLYHYTDEAGMNGILASERLNPSLKALSPNDARHGDGQYFSDILPGTRTPGQLSKEFLNVPYHGRKFTHYIEVDTWGLRVDLGRPNVYVIAGRTPLPLGGRIVNSGRIPGK